MWDQHIDCKISGGSHRSFKRDQMVKVCRKYVMKGSLDWSHIWYVHVPYWVQKPYCVVWRSKVTSGQHRSNLEHHGHESKLRLISYTASLWITLSAKSTEHFSWRSNIIWGRTVKMLKSHVYLINISKIWIGTDLIHRTMVDYVICLVTCLTVHELFIIVHLLLNK